VTDTRSDRFRTVFLIATGAGVVLAATVAIAQGIVDPAVAAAFVAFVAAGEITSVRLPGNRLAAPLASAGALGYAMLFDVGRQPVDLRLAQVVAVVSVGGLVGVAVQWAGGRAPRWTDVGRLALLATVVGAGFRLSAPEALTSDGLDSFKNELRWVAILMITLAAFGSIIDVIVAALLQTGRQQAAFGFLVRDEILATAGLSAAVCATGVLTALATPTMQLYALPIFGVPLLLTQFAFRRFAAIRATYLQTIRSLSRVTEVGGYVEDGHARRVSRLALAVGRDLGLSERELLDLEYAALLHDIGQLSLIDPIPGGSTLVVAPIERRRVAELGADVIRTTGVLDHVAEVVARQADPYRRHRQPPDDTLPLESRIIKAASAYDDLVGATGSGELVADALERLRLGMAYEYDPKVVDSLAQLVGRRLESSERIHQNPA
jgi:hypothetical protein